MKSCWGLFIGALLMENFWASLAVWFIMPLPIALFVTFYDDRDNDFPTPCGKIIFKGWSCLKGKSRFLLPLHYLIRFIWGYAITFIMLYLWIPGTDIYLGVQNLFCHEKYKEYEHDEKHAKMPVAKLFEEFGEAIPQFVIAVTFYDNSAYWLPLSDLQFGIFTMVMSAGSIVMGAHTCPRSEQLCPSSKPLAAYSLI